MQQQKRNTLKLIGAGAVATTLPTTVSAAPKRGGTIRVGLSGGSASDSFNPEHTIAGMLGFVYLVCNRLVQEVGDTGAIKPELAESWESQNQNREWIFNLRQGVKFHDGSTFDADDVIYSIKLHTKESSKSGGKAYLTDLKDIVKMSKYQVKFVFNNPNPDVPSVFSLYNYPMVKNGHTDWLNPNGTGGYTLESFDPGVKVVLTRQNNYWRDDSAWADSFELIYFRDSQSTVNALLSGAVDVIFGVQTNIVKRLESSSKINVVKSSGKGHFTWPMMQSNAPYDDVNVRMALKYGIDRKKIVEIGLNGYGTIGNDNPISDAYADYVAVKQITYDMDKAKYYLKKSGRSKLDISLSVSDAAVGAASEASALVFKESVKSTGINLNVVREPADGYWANVWMKKPFSTSFWNGRPTATMMFDTAYISASKWNESEFKNKTFDNLVKDAKSSSSASERKQKLGEAQRLITEEGSVIIPTFRMTIEASSNRIGGHLPTKAQNINNTYFEQMWIK